MQTSCGFPPPPDLPFPKGFAVGGEFTSTIVFLVEHAPPERRGLYGSFAFASILPGVILGSLITTIFTAALTEDQLMLWGWRVPFLMSILGAALGVHIRRKLEVRNWSRLCCNDLSFWCKQTFGC